MVIILSVIVTNTKDHEKKEWIVYSSLIGPWEFHLHRQLYKMQSQEA